MRKYPKYKASGVDWLGEIPNGWNIISLKHLVKIKVTDGPHETPVAVENGIPFVSAEAVQNHTINFDSKWGFISKEDHLKYSKKCKPINGDIFIVKSGATTGKVAYINTDIEFNIWSPLALVRANEKSVISRYLFNYIVSPLFQEQVQFSWSFGTQQNIGMGVIQNLLIVIPSLPEQHDIVRFLDYKTLQIDSFIANRQKQIELLKEQKSGIINKAVTKGINPNAKMKDSGIDWIGEVPEHWEIWKTKFLCKKVSTGNTPSSDELKYYENGTINWFTPGDFKDDFKMENSQRKVTEVAIEEKECKLFSPYSTYVIGIGATLGKVRMSETTASANQQINVLEFNKKVVPAFGFFYFYSIEKTIIANANLSTMGIINQTKMKSLEMTVPPIDEQSAILNYINNENLTFDNLISKYQKQIELMQEYRTSLISQAVTGKIDVREWQPKKQQTA
jgi:type I restriction enzyme, S subunit